MSLLRRLKCAARKHNWFKFTGDYGTVKFTNGTDTEYRVTAKVCLKCKTVEWDFVSGNLPFEE